jgi:hypothetical protein
MFSGFITTKKVIPVIGVHQRLDMAARRIIKPYLAPKSFPTARAILQFEGLDGPDGLKLKSPGVAEPKQLYDPLTETGEVPRFIELHYLNLVSSLREKDMIRSAFEASWLAHFVTDGLTPAHHFPLHDELSKIKGHEAGKEKSFLKKGFHMNGSISDAISNNWAIWGAKGLLSTHMNFEMGVAMIFITSRIRGKLDHSKLAHARTVGPVLFFKEEALDIANLDLYGQFYEHGWTNGLARSIKHRLAPQTAQTIGILWLLAYLEAASENVTMNA